MSQTYTHRLEAAYSRLGALWSPEGHNYLNTAGIHECMNADNYIYNPDMHGVQSMRISAISAC